MDFKKVDRKLGALKLLFLFSLLFYILICASYIYYGVTFEPPSKKILLNQMGGVYVSEDLGKTNASEGEVKQFAYNVISKTFGYDFISYASADEYEKIVSGEKESDLPDHREIFKPYYSKEAYEKVKSDLISQEWMRNFHFERRQLRVSFIEPPAKVRADGFYKNAQGRLTIEYKGHFFLISNSNSYKQKTFKVSYEISLERKPLIIRDSDDDNKTYYFDPLVPRNTMEWRVEKFSFESERRT